MASGGKTRVSGRDYLLVRPEDEPEPAPLEEAGGHVGAEEAPAATVWVRLDAGLGARVIPEGRVDRAQLLLPRRHRVEFRAHVRVH